MQPEGRRLLMREGVPAKSVGVDAIHHSFQGIRLGRLHKVIVKARGNGLAPIRLLPPTGECDQVGVFSPRPLQNLPRSLVAVEERHPNIEEYKLRGKLIACCKRLDSVVDCTHFMTFEPEQHRKRMCRVAIIIGHQDAHSPGRLGRCSGIVCHIIACRTL